jgi:AraC-like DNA-binding protein
VTRAVDHLLKSIRIVEATFALIDLRGDSGYVVRSDGRPTFHLVLAGQPLLLKTPGSARRLAVGDLLFAFKDEPYTLLATPSALGHWLYFDSAHYAETPRTIMVGRGSVATKILSCAFSLNLSTLTSFRRMLPDMLVVSGSNSCIRVDHAALQLVRPPSAGTSAFLLKLVEFYLIEAVRNGTARFVLPEGGLAVSPHSLNQIFAAVQIMACEPEKHWSLAGLARRVGMSRSAFAAAFRRVLGRPPLQYLTESRMRRAAELLRIGDLPIKEISRRVGYDTDIAFARVFKKFSGVTAREYRRAERNADRNYCVALDHWNDFVAGVG